jgi:GNAT superfamily N-acetyltransferase
MRDRSRPTDEPGAPAPYRIRPTQAADLCHLPDVERSAGERFRASDLAWIADQPRLPVESHARYLGWHWVATDADDRPVGFILARPSGNMIHIGEVSVAQPHQGRGLGRALITAVRAKACRQGYGGLTLTTYRDIAWNGPYYASLGFREMMWDELPSFLREQLAEEARHGHDLARRVAMVLALA